MLLPAIAILCFAGAAAAAEEVSVEASRLDGAVQARAHALVAATWDTLTDYEPLPAFIPGMKSSRVVARNGHAATVEQVGETSFPFFSFPIEVTVLSKARPPEAIDVRALKSNFRRLAVC